MKLPTLHDKILSSYHVYCRDKKIILETMEQISKGKYEDFVEIEFYGVKGYRFWDDALCSVIALLEQVEIERLLDKYHQDIKESTALGKWAFDVEKVKVDLLNSGVKGIEITSSWGMSGWIIAQGWNARPLPK